MRLPGEDILASDFLSSLTLGESLTGETLPVPIYQSTADGKAYKALANDVAKIGFSGFCISTASADAAGWIVNDGLVGGFSGLTSGADYYLQDDGTIGTSKGTYSVKVGQARSASIIRIIHEDRVDERWMEQFIADQNGNTMTYQYDFAFDEDHENLYLVYPIGTSSTSIYITRFKKDRRTGRFMWEADQSISSSSDPTCGVAVYNDKVYVCSYYATAQHINRLDLDLSNMTEMTISGGSANEKGAMTNIGSTFYIHDTNTHTTIGTYTLSGTTFTRTGGISVGGINTYPARCLSTDGTYFYVAYSSGSAIDYSAMAIKRVSIAGGTFSTLTKFSSNSGIAGLIPYNGTEFIAIYALDSYANAPMWQLAKVYI